eukprot:364743-Chlamydomonas_euryale.AAC.48
MCGAAPARSLPPRQLQQRVTSSQVLRWAVCCRRSPGPPAARRWHQRSYFRNEGRDEESSRPEPTYANARTGRRRSCRAGPRVCAGASRIPPPTPCAPRHHRGGWRAAASGGRAGGGRGGGAARTRTSSEPG